MFGELLPVTVPCWFCPLFFSLTVQTADGTYRRTLYRYLSDAVRTVSLPSAQVVTRSMVRTHRSHALSVIPGFFYDRGIPQQKAARRNRRQHSAGTRPEAFVWRGVKSQDIYPRLAHLPWDAAAVRQETAGPVGVCAPTVLVSDIIHRDSTSVEVRKLLCD